jgi:hypothetical protein
MCAKLGESLPAEVLRHAMSEMDPQVHRAVFHETNQRSG